MPFPVDLAFVKNTEAQLGLSFRVVWSERGVSRSIARCGERR